ncbi:ATP-dependent zinc protease [candidate division KSB1 bacterium]|nr:MAG: ATP-dependent zinc protease [candidate division KSB1 bacterium]
MMTEAPPKKIIGWREWIRLDKLNLPPIKAKIDTGARSSTLHAFKVKSFTRKGRRWVRFSVHPDQYDTQRAITCEAPVIDRRSVTDSGGHRTLRYVIASEITLGDETWPIELTLTNRDNMKFRMLLGRTAMEGRYLVDPERSYCIGKAPPFRLRKQWLIMQSTAPS